MIFLAIFGNVAVKDFSSTIRIREHCKKDIHDIDSVMPLDHFESNMDEATGMPPGGDRCNDF